MKKTLLVIPLFLLGLGAFFKLKSPALTVAKVIDGDTIGLSDGRTIRYIGIDTPELKDNECFAREAKAINEELLKDKKIRIETDTNEVDQFGRTLACIYADNLFINKELLLRGAEKYYQDNLNTKYSDKLIWVAEMPIPKCMVYGKPALPMKTAA